MTIRKLRLISNISYSGLLRRCLITGILLFCFMLTSLVMADNYLPGKIVRADLLTSDIEVAATFYSKVFGWQLERHITDGYIDASVYGHPVATFSTYPDVVADNDEALWLVSISVNDVDTAVSMAVNNGGKILERAANVPGIGRIAVIRDNTGAVFMLLRNENSDPADAPVAYNEWLWPELWTNRPDEAEQFYVKVVGYKAVRYKGRKGNDFRILGRNGLACATILRTPLPDVEPNWLLYLKVKNVHDAIRAVTDNGGTILLPPMKDALNDDVAIVADPTGGVFALQSAGDDS